MKKIPESELGLVVHPTKTKIVDNLREPFTFLGYSFKVGYFHTPSEEAVRKFKDKMRGLTKRNLSVNLEVFIKKRLNPVLRGWARYFGIGFCKTLFLYLDKWVRRRLRMIQLRSWRKIKKLHKELRKRGWRGELPRLRMTKWRSSQSPPVSIAIPNERFRELPLVHLYDIYQDLHPKRG